MEKEKPILSVHGITKYFPGTVALNKVSFDIYPGEIHAIMGENGAGKSTLMKIFSGIYQADEGEFIFNDKHVKLSSPKEAKATGISIVHQELSLCSHLSVAENVFIGNVPRNKWGFIKHRELNEKTKRLLDRFHAATIGVNQIVGDLNVSDQQIVEISKALTTNCKVLILDEPTSSLSEREADLLFQVIHELKRDGIAILYISHKFNEIFTHCDRLSVLRDGKYVGGDLVRNLNRDQVIAMMVGRSLDQFYPPKGTPSADVILSVDRISRNKTIVDVSFNLHKGEILGIFGLVGAGRTELARAIVGLDVKDSGTVTIYHNSVPTNLDNFKKSMLEGVFYLTEDRKHLGLFLDKNLMDNTVVTNMKKVSIKGLIKDAKVLEETKTQIQKMNIKTSSVSQKVGDLSGGNQQKLMIGKWMYNKPTILIMDEPTRGIDVGAKSEIHQMLRHLSNQGMGVIVISSELPEIIGISDRIMVMHQGSIKGTITEDRNMTEHDIMKMASGMA
jgi:ribose transport system ATP-binding protein